MGIFDSFYKKDINASEPGTPMVKGPRYKIGDRIAQRFEIYQILGGEGKSGMGIVFVCYDHEEKGVITLKTFQEQFLSSKRMKDNFKKEALLWIHLERYPFIVRAYWAQELDYRMFVVCEFIAPDDQGRNTLTHYLKRPITMKQALTWAIQFCYGMEYAYSKGVTPHRDIKPDNIMITRDGIVKITDFGLAGLWDNVASAGEFKDLMSEDRKGLTFIKSEGGKVVSGTPPWMAPEQFDGKADVKSDIYSFGIVMYQMVSQGELPFYPRRGDDWEMVHKRYSVPEINSRLYPIIKMCLLKNPEKRYQTFNELKKNLGLLYRKEINQDPPSPPETSKFEVWELINKGFSLQNLGLFDEAIREYREALKINPGLVGVHTHLGVALGKKGLLDEEIKEYREALRINPEDAEAHLNQGNALEKKGLFDEAIKEYREALRINPENAEAHSNLGVALGEKGLFDEAIREYREALRIDSGYTSAYYNLGSVLGEKGLFDEAIKEFKEALRINPEDAEAHSMIGIALGEKGLFDEAIKEFKEALRINPEDAEAHLNLGNAFLDKKLSDEAIREYREALRIDPELAEDHNNRGIELQRKGLLDEAIKEHRRALFIDSELAVAHYYLGNALVYKGLRDEAIDEYREALRINPEYANAHIDLGSILADKGLFDEAIKEYQNALRINPELEVAHFNMGLALDTKGLFDESIKEFREALRINPEYAVVYLNLGRVLNKKGLFDEGIISYENFIRYAQPQNIFQVELVKEAIIKLRSKK